MQQRLFTYLRNALLAEGYSVYDGEIPPDAEYPFVLLGEAQDMGYPTKGAIYGEIYQTVHVYHNDIGKRGTVSNMLTKIRDACIRSPLIFVSASVQIMPDNSTGSMMHHGIVDAHFKY